jgi:hypothetical protein
MIASTFFILFSSSQFVQKRSGLVDDFPYG